MKYSIAELELKAVRVWVEDRTICLRLSDEREIRFPASKNRRMRKASADQLSRVELICDGTGLHWSDLDEDLSVQGILEGRLGQSQASFRSIIVEIIDRIDTQAQRIGGVKFKATVETSADGGCVASCDDPQCSGHGLSPTNALDALREEIRYRLELCPCTGVSDDYVELDVVSGL